MSDYSHKLTKRNAEDVQTTVRTLADVVRRLANHMSGEMVDDIKRLANQHEERVEKIFHDSEVRT